MIARITPSGQITEYPLPKGSDPEGIASGKKAASGSPVGNSRIGRISASGEVTQISLPEGHPSESEANIDRTRATRNHLVHRPGRDREIDGARPDHSVSVSFVQPIPREEREEAGYRSGPGNITTGPEGNLWFTETVWISSYFYNRVEVRGIVGRITPDGQITDFYVSNEYTPDQVTAGPDGDVWYTASSNALCEGGGTGCIYWNPPGWLVGRITPGLLAIEIESERVPVRRGLAKLELRCGGGNAHSACSGILRLNFESKSKAILSTGPLTAFLQERAERYRFASTQRHTD